VHLFDVAAVVNTASGGRHVIQHVFIFIPLPVISFDVW